MPDDRLLILGLESTCDETGAAVIEGPVPPREGVPRVLSSVVASQIDLHLRFGGVVPEIASRAHLRQVLPVIDQALKQAGASLDDLGAIAVATRPGLVGSLVVGLTAAKRWPWRLMSPWSRSTTSKAIFMPARSPIPRRRFTPVSDWSSREVTPASTTAEGRSTSNCSAAPSTTPLAKPSTRLPACSDWAIPAVPRSSGSRNRAIPGAHAFPRAFLRDERLAFSFSGLKTAVLYALKGQDARHSSEKPDPQTIADLAASFQAAVVDVLVGKAAQALRQTGLRRLGIGGGVAANRAFRDRLGEMAEREGIELFIPPMSLCTDNAALAAIAFPKLAAGQTAELDIDVTPGLVRPKPNREMRPAPLVDAGLGMPGRLISPRLPLEE